MSTESMSDSASGVHDVDATDAEDDEAIVTRSEFEQLREELTSLRRQHNDVDAFARDYLKQQVDDAHEEIEMLTEQLQHTRSALSEIESQVENFLGPVGGRSSKEKRVADLRLSMIRSAQAADQKGCRKWWKEVRSTLVEKGYDPELSKPTWVNTMKTAAQGDGFCMTTKTKANGREVQAVKVKLADLPDEARSNQLTTSRDATGAGDSGITAEHVTTD